MKKPYIPYVSFIGHQDVVADIAWPKSNSNKIYSCGKDNTLMVQNMKTAYKPYEHIRTVSLSWTPKGELAAVTDKINRLTHEEYVFIYFPAIFFYLIFRIFFYIFFLFFLYFF